MKLGKQIWIISLLIIMALLIAACGGGAPAEQSAGEGEQQSQAEPEQQAEPGEEPAAEPAAEPTKEPEAEEPTDAPAQSAAPAGPYEHLARAEAGEFEGQEVSIFSVWVDEDEESFKAALQPFIERTGIKINYEGSRDFETLITVRVEGDNAPDIAGFPQPALMASFARDNKLVDLSSFMNVDQLQQDYIQSWLDLGTIDGKLHGVFYRTAIKSLVWYPVKAFEEKGYEVPQTWDELIELSDTIAADGQTPWCIGLEHGGATGWYATDWVEDILLRTAGPEVYDQWTRHEIPFNHPSVKQAAEIMAEIWLNEEYVYGGKTGILTIPVADTQTPMFEDPPACWFYRQAGWATGFFPEGMTAPEDSNFFYLPPINPEQGKPVLGGGDVFVMFNDRPAVRAVLEYLATPEAARPWIEQGGFISPNKSVPLDWYPGQVDRGQAEIIKNATTFRFDASDLMPPQVGTGTFWTGMVDWINGKELDTVLQEIEGSWPATSN